MESRSFEERLTILEEQMKELRELPARLSSVELRIVQPRDESRAGFIAMRAEMHGIRDELRTEMHGIRDEIQSEIHAMGTILRQEIRTSQDESQRFMRILYEDLKQDLKIIRDGR